MQNPTWKFRQMTRGEINSDPVQNEFFSNTALDSLGDALVRETVQNSLDAGVAGEKICVRFKFCDGKGIGTERGQYLNGLSPHLRAKSSGLINLPDLQDDVDVLIIEDFGTRGLEGDPQQNDDRDNTRKWPEK